MSKRLATDVLVGDVFCKASKRSQEFQKDFVTEDSRCQLGWRGGGRRLFAVTVSLSGRGPVWPEMLVRSVRS